MIQSGLAFKTLSSDLRVDADIGDIACIDADAGKLQLELCGSTTRLIEQTPYEYAIKSVMPNPMTGTGVISFSLGLDGQTLLEIYDATGTNVAIVIDKYLEAGEYTIGVESSALPSGYTVTG